MSTYYTILTKAGENKIANAISTGTKITFTNFALGDSNGVHYEPDRNSTGLKNEVWRGSVTKVATRDNNPNWVSIEVGVPASDGGFTIREAGLYDASGELLAIGKYPETVKPALTSGSAKDLFIRMVIEVASANNVELVMDMENALASQKDLDILTLEVGTKATKAELSSEVGKLATKTELKALTTEVSNKATTVEVNKKVDKTYMTSHEKKEAPHQYGGKFEWKYNSTNQSLELVTLP